MFARVRIDIAAPPTRVFAVLRDPEKRRGWIAGLVETRQTGGKPGAVDSTFTDVIVDGNQKRREFQGVVLANDFPTRLTIRQEEPNITVTSEWTLVQQAPGTRLTYAAKSMPRSWVLRLLSPIANSMVRQVIRKQAKRIKMLAES